MVYGAYNEAAMNITRQLQRCVTVVFLIGVIGTAREGVGSVRPEPSLDAGFRLLYNLDFTEAQHQFADYEHSHPQDPLGPASESAGLLFQELSRLGVLEAQFFTNDESFKSTSKLSPDPLIRKRFDVALVRAESLARAQLAQHPDDRDALLAVTLAAGLHADYTALIEKRNFAALHFTREATESARALLTVCPNCYDAYVATGISEYLVGSVAAPFRWMLHLGGYRGDKQKGIEQLQLAGEHGHYLAPFARILLAIAYLREHHPDQARAILAELQRDFPGNQLFARELSHLQQVSP